MTRYLISFDDGAMTFPEEELPDVAAAAHAVVQEAMDGGVWVFGGGLHSHEEVSVVATDGTVTDGHPESKAYIGGFSVVDVPSSEEALEWAAKTRRLPLCSRGPRVPARPSGRQLIEAQWPAHAHGSRTEQSPGRAFRNDPEGREVAYDVGSTTLVTTQRCLPILRSGMNPSFS